VNRALLLLGAVGCGSTPTVMSSPVVRGEAEAAPSPESEEAERLWAERLDVEKLRGAIAAWRKAVAAADDDAATWARLAEADYFLADGFLAGDAAEQAFEDGAAAAERGLRALAPDFEHRRTDGQDVADAAAGLDARAAPLLYWWGQNVIRWADLKGRFTAARTFKGVKRVMEQVAQLAPALDHGGADRYLGAFYAEAPGIAGGDLTQSRTHFDRALAIDANFLGNHLERAQHWARRAGDAAAYQAGIAQVRATAAGSPEEEIAKRKAMKLPEKL
jgi:hypothetical protein